MYIRKASTPWRIDRTQYDPHAPARDPRVALPVDKHVGGVIDHGHRRKVRVRGFTAARRREDQALHTTAVAGSTSNLLCMCGVGFDDNRDLGFQGQVLPAPIWGGFMKRRSLPAYSNVRFSGCRKASCESHRSDTMQLATPECPITRERVYVHARSDRNSVLARGPWQRRAASLMAVEFSAARSLDAASPSSAGSDAKNPRRPGSGGGTPEGDSVRGGEPKGSLQAYFWYL